MDQKPKITRRQANNAMHLLRTYPFLDKFNIYATSRNIKKLAKIEDETAELLAEVDFKHCLKDEKTKCIIESSEGLRSYTEESRKIMIKEKSLIMEQSVDFEAYEFPENKESKEFSPFLIQRDIEIFAPKLCAEPEKE